MKSSDFCYRNYLLLITKLILLIYLSQIIKPELLPKLYGFAFVLAFYIGNKFSKI
jgi:hypothetical protein